MKKLVIGCVALALVLGLVPLATAQEEITLSILAGDWWFDPEGQSYVGGSNGYTMMQEYMEMHPEISFDVRGVPFPELDNTQMAALQARQGPDILIVNSVTVGAFIDRGYLMPLDDLIEASGLDTDVFFPSLFAAGVFQGQVFALPVDTGTRVLYWHRALFEEAGIEPPTTWEELPEVAVQMTNPETGVNGFVGTAGERWVWLYEHAGMYATANGLHFVNEDATECVLDQGDNPQIIQFWVDMFNAGVMSQDDLLVGTGAERELGFGNGRAAMYMGGFWSAPVLESDYGLVYPDDYGIVALEGSAGIGSSTGGWLLAISRDAQHPQEAMDFVAWLLGTPENIARFTNLMPSTEAANELVLQEEFYDIFKELLASPNTRHPIPLNPGLPVQAEVLRNVTQAAMLGEMTVEEAAASFCAQIEGTLFQP